MSDNDKIDTGSARRKRTVRLVIVAFVLAFVACGGLLGWLRMRQVKEDAIAADLSNRFGARFTTASAAEAARGSRPDSLVAYFSNTIAEIDLSIPTGYDPFSVTPKKVDGRDLALLKSFSALRVLNLRGQPIDDASLAVLRELSTLEELNIRETELSAEGIDEFRTTLPSCNVISD